MSKFYTNAMQFGNNILVRGYDRGFPFNEKIPYKPTMFVQSKHENASWSDIRGLSLEPIQFESINEAKDFLKQYEDVTNFNIFGLQRFVYTYLNEEYPTDVPYDREQIKVAYLDIEVSSENGFPAVERASDIVTAITLKKGPIFHVFGLKPYMPTPFLGTSLM